MKSIFKRMLYLLSSIIYYNRDSKVIYLHDIHFDIEYATMDVSMPLERFERLVRVVREERFEFVSQITKSKNQIQLCFDDGYRGIWDCREFFYKNSICPTVFIAYNLLDKPNYLKRKELIELQKHGFVFQAHTMNHVALTELDNDELEVELKEAKVNLSELLQHEVTEVCLPIGYYNEKVIMEAQKYYCNIYSSIPGSYFSRTIGNMICRNLCQGLDEKMITYTLLGGQQIFAKRMLKRHYKI